MNILDFISKIAKIGRIIMKLKKRLSVLLLCVIMICASSIPAFASNAESAASPPPTSVGSDPATRATQQITFTNLGVNNVKLSSGTYQLKTSDTLVYSISWSPSGQSIKIALRNVQSGVYYDGNNMLLNGGLASGSKTVSSFGAPAGEYYVCVINTYGNPSSTTGILTYEWK